ncbi:MAG TPA: hypothetical protein VFB08_17435 [Burkholderiales bacterium]|nr:hypothetical protein [Burkholderiales bacterium]
MKRPALLALSAILAGAMSATVFAAGTNEKNPDSPATGMTGTGSNATDPNAGGASVGSSTVVVPAQPTVVVPAQPTTSAPVTTAPATGTIVAPAQPAVVVPAQPAGTVVYPSGSNVNPDPASTNHGAVGGESAGKSSDSPAQ